MSKRALGFLLAFFVTASLLYSSIFTAFCESEFSGDATSLGETYTSEDALTGVDGEEYPSGSESSSEAVTAAPSTVSLALYPVLTVSAISNYFGRIDAEYNEFTREITVTYLLKSSRRLLSVYWTLSYDSELLTVDPKKNTAATICPMMKDDAIMSIDSKKGVICFSANDLRMFDYTTSEAVFVKIVFDTAQLTHKDSEITKVDLSVSDLIVSEPNPQTGESFDGKEVALVANSKAKKTDVQVSKYTTITPSTFVEPSANPATPEQKLTTSPPTTVKPSPATQPTKPQQEKEKKTDSDTLLYTGTWYVALLILVILLICSTILFIMRKRDIYNN